MSVQSEKSPISLRRRQLKQSSRESIRRLLDEGDLRPLSEIRNAALANGMKTLKSDGFQKVLEGHTTVEEVMRVVFTAGGQ